MTSISTREADRFDWPVNHTNPAWKPEYAPG